MYEEKRMNATGVAQRRGFAIVVLLAAIALAAWLIQARLDSPSKAAATTPAAAAQAEAPEAAPGGGGGAEGYGGQASGGEAAGAPAAQAAGKPTNSLTARKLPRMGDAVTDEKGWILYRFDKDSNNPPTSNCVDACAEAWPPVLAGSDDIELKLNGIDRSLAGMIDRAEC